MKYNQQQVSLLGRNTGNKMNAHDFSLSLPKSWDTPASCVRLVGFIPSKTVKAVPQKVT